MFRPQQHAANCKCKKCREKRAAEDGDSQATGSAGSGYTAPASSSAEGSAQAPPSTKPAKKATEQPAWHKSMVEALATKVNTGDQVLTASGFDRLLEDHTVAPEGTAEAALTLLGRWAEDDGRGAASAAAIAAAAARQATQAALTSGPAHAKNCRCKRCREAREGNAINEAPNAPRPSSLTRETSGAGLLQFRIERLSGDGSRLRFVGESEHLGQLRGVLAPLRSLSGGNLQTNAGSTADTEQDRYIGFVRASLGLRMREEIKQDIFALPDTYALCQCVPVNFDIQLGLGVQFKSKFGRIEECLRQRPRLGGLCSLEPNARMRQRVYYLTTKRNAGDEATYENMRSSLEALRERVVAAGVEKLAMPQIGCGTDKLDWGRVRSMIREVFENEDIEILVSIWGGGALAALPSASKATVQAAAAAEASLEVSIGRLDENSLEVWHREVDANGSSRGSWHKIRANTVEPITNFGKELCDAEQFAEERVHFTVMDGMRCGICFDDNLAEGLVKPCLHPSCEGLYCRDCIQQFLKAKIESSRYSVPMIQCPGCRSRVPTVIWSKLAEPDVVRMYEQSAAALLTLRCPGCHGSHSLHLGSRCLQQSAHEKDKILARALGQLAEVDQLKAVRAWRSFNAGSSSPKVFMEELAALLLAPSYGSVEMSSQMVIADVSCRVAPEALMKQMTAYGSDRGDLQGVVQGALEGFSVLMLISDTERRVALQLAFLRRFPFLEFTGCGRPCKMCFKCKTSGHHNPTCDEMQARELNVECQFCPSCGVATQRTEGCNQMICVCGQYWEWRGTGHTNATVPTYRHEYPPCWGGSMLALKPGGGFVQIRDVREGDEVCTVRGVRRVARIWHEEMSAREEVCCINGVWITSHHPVIYGRNWVFPSEVARSYPWPQVEAEVVDVYNFELEGHDDTIILLGSGEDARQPVISCTLGKYLGQRFGWNVCTRVSVRCEDDCAQCDAAFVEGMDFAHIPGHLRWRRFDPVPQVYWGEMPPGHEFDCAREVILSWRESGELPTWHPGRTGYELSIYPARSTLSSAANGSGSSPARL